MPMPPEMHRVARPSVASRSRSSYAHVSTMRAPVIPIVYAFPAPASSETIAGRADVSPDSTSVSMRAVLARSPRRTPSASSSGSSRGRVAEAGIAFTSVGVITADPASVESVLAWASRLRDRTAYLIVENSITEHTDFRYWRETHQALLFQQTYSPAIVRMDFRLPVFENATRNHGVTLGAVAARLTSAPELRQSSLVMRAQSYRRRLFAEFDKVQELLLP